MQDGISVWGRRLGVTAAVLALVACASQGPATTRTAKTYPFTVVTKVDTADEVVSITVNPRGGNARIKLDKTVDQVLSWQSNTEFMIRFEPLGSDAGPGGDDLGGPDKWTSATQSNPGKYTYSLKLNPDQPGGGVYTTKYFLKRRLSDTYELDPVVIVDR